MKLYMDVDGTTMMQKWREYHDLKGYQDLLLLRQSDNGRERDIARMFEVALLSAAGTVLTLFNPEKLVQGGGIVSANPYLLEMLREQIPAYALREAAKRVSMVQICLKDAPLERAKYLEERL